MTPIWDDTRVWYTALVALVAIQRLVEIVVSTRNARRMLAAGGQESGKGHLPAMVAVHVLFLIACPLEVWLLSRPLIVPLAVTMLAIALATQVLRYWAIRSLRGRWTVRVITLPQRPPISGGPYRYIRHPNYLAVVLEFVAVPLIHSAWVTALTFSLLNAWVLKVRINAEERALKNAGGYEPLIARRRWVPLGTKR